MLLARWPVCWFDRLLVGWLVVWFAGYVGGCLLSGFVASWLADWLRSSPWCVFVLFLGVCVFFASFLCLVSPLFIPPLVWSGVIN